MILPSWIICRHVSKLQIKKKNPFPKQSITVQCKHKFKNYNRCSSRFSQRKGGASISSMIVDGSMVDCRHGGGGFLSGDKEETRRQREAEGACSILSLMALALVNKQALFICIHAYIWLVSAPCSITGNWAYKLQTQESHGVKSRGRGGGSLKWKPGATWEAEFQMTPLVARPAQQKD